MPFPSAAPPGQVPTQTPASRRTRRGLTVCSLALIGLAVSLAPFERAGEAQAGGEEPTCGQELAADAEVPEALSALMQHVATNMETHARWVGASAGGSRERDALLKVAREYEAIADSADRAARAMKEMKAIPAVKHDPARLDRAGQGAWMRKKIDMQLAFARLLTDHAATSKQALRQMER